jgi:D-serine deaminase-like pyridoxal phosphate-dependent protein
MGITVARVRHAEALVASGVGNILVASEIVDDDSLQRLIEISRRAEVILCVDNEENIARIARLAGDAKPNINLVIDLEVGLGRCGAPPKEALRLARMARDAGLRVRGLMGYEGHLQKLAPTEQTQSLRRRLPG